MSDNSNLSAFNDFESAARSVTSLLHQRLGLTMWMITRVQSEQFIVLSADERPASGYSYLLKPGDAVPWSDTICYRRMNGQGPTIAADVRDVPDYVTAPICLSKLIGAYVGVPLMKEDGAVFGMLCGIAPFPIEPPTEAETALVEMLGRLLSTVLSQELRLQETAREADRCRMESMRDEPTGLYNRRAIHGLMQAEENRCRRYGHAASVVVIDLNGLKIVNDAQGHAAGDEMIRSASDCIRAAARDVDIVGRLGGDEFVVVAIECDEQGAEALVARIRGHLSTAGLSAGIGVAARQTGQTLRDAMDAADQRMYADKRRGKAAGASPVYHGYAA